MGEILGGKLPAIYIEFKCLDLFACFLHEACFCGVNNGLVNVMLHHRRIAYLSGK